MTGTMSLLRIKKRTIFSISLSLEIFERDESESCRVHTVTLPSLVLWTVVEYVTEMRISILGSHFDTSREELLVFFEFYCIGVNRLGKARPSSSRVILVE